MILTFFLGFSLMFISEYLKRREREVDIYTKSLKIYIKSYQNYQKIKKLLILFDMIFYLLIT